LPTAPSIFVTFPHSQIVSDSSMIATKEIGINIFIDSCNIELTSMINFLRSIQFNYIFSLSGDILDPANIATVLPKLYTLFTLSGCFHNCINYVPVFINTNEKYAASPELIKRYFQSQGNSDIEFLILSSSPTLPVIKNNILILEYSQLETFNESNLEKYNDLSLQQVLLISHHTQSKSNNLQEIESVINSNRFLKEFLKQVRSKIEISRQLYETDLWKKRAGLYYSFIGLSKKVGENQYYDILKWYNDEYEVLPVWYKRVGHIIKYITGKKKLRESKHINM
jgi:hypothetical protein